MIGRLFGIVIIEYPFSKTSFHNLYTLSMNLSDSVLFLLLTLPRYQSDWLNTADWFGDDSH